jgi:hypothetical protein
MLGLAHQVGPVGPVGRAAAREDAGRADGGAGDQELAAIQLRHRHFLYPGRTVQHSRLILNVLGRARHAFRHLAPDDPGYFGFARTQRNVIAVTGACLLTPGETLHRLGLTSPTPLSTAT